jgi:hypothetical protein
MAMPLRGLGAITQPTIGRLWATFPSECRGHAGTKLGVALIERTTPFARLMLNPQRKHRPTGGRFADRLSGNDKSPQFSSVPKAHGEDKTVCTASVRVRLVRADRPAIQALARHRLRDDPGVKRTAQTFRTAAKKLIRAFTSLKR